MEGGGGPKRRNPEECTIIAFWYTMHYRVGFSKNVPRSYEKNFFWGLRPHFSDATPVWNPLIHGKKWKKKGGKGPT